MIMRYGGKFFGGKTAGGLKGKWRNIREIHECDIGCYRHLLYF